MQYFISKHKIKRNYFLKFFYNRKKIFHLIFENFILIPKSDGYFIHLLIIE